MCSLFALLAIAAALVKAALHQRRSTSFCGAGRGSVSHRFFFSRDDVVDQTIKPSTYLVCVPGIESLCFGGGGANKNLVPGRVVG